MSFKYDTMERWLARQDKWERWFAWRPVTLHFDDGRAAGRVKRRS